MPFSLKNNASILNDDLPSRNFKFEQVRDEIIRNILDGNLKKGDRIPAISEACETYRLSKVTVGRAYMHLKNHDYITYISGKGFFVSGQENESLRVMLVGGPSDNTRELIYNGLLDALGNGIVINLHSATALADDHWTSYHFYVLMPNFYQDRSFEASLKIIKKIPCRRLVILDKRTSELQPGYITVYQHMEADVYNALCTVADLLQRYRCLSAVSARYHTYETEITAGVSKFCRHTAFKFDQFEDAANMPLIKGTAFIVIEESELVLLIKRIRETNLRIGKDIGIISLNETAFNELLEITAFSADFPGMGKVAGQMMRNNRHIIMRNKFNVIRRRSL